MKKALFFILLLPLMACHHVEVPENHPEGNFDALWQVIDTHYCFFREKNIDWDSVKAVYRPLVTPKTTATELYTISASMLDVLKDGHVNLTTPFASSYYKKWWTDYPQNYDQRLVEQSYLHFGGLTRGALTYAILPDSVAYVRYSTFSAGIGQGTLDWLFALISPAKAMVFDIRDNGGGDLTTARDFIARFITRRICAGYICHKTGPGHADFSEPFPFYYDPAPEPRVKWLKPIVILTNRSTFSAANNFVAIMRTLADVKIVGDTTGGGSGMPFSSEIPCGWSVRFSASPIYDPQMRLTEFGIEPDVHIDIDPELALKGIDTMLDKAIQMALWMAEK